MGIRLGKLSALLLVATSLVFTADWALAAVEDLAVTDRQQVSKRRVGRAHFDYTFTITLSNTGGPLDNVVGTITSLSPNTEIREGTVSFGNIASGVIQSVDTFTMRQNRRVLFNPNDLVWSFTADEPVLNTAPVADAGSDQSLDVNVVVTLNGGNSSDADNDPLTYSWTLSRPAGSSAMLSSSTAVEPTFAADVAGGYSATLIVNDGTVDSAPDTALITANAVNLPPSLAAVANQQVTIGENIAVPLVGQDPENTPLTYSLDAAPAGMDVNPNTGLIQWTPMFGQLGANAVTARVTDAEGLFVTTSFTVTVNDVPNTAPMADAGPNQTVDAGTAVQLDGSQSSDADNDPLTYAWSLARPAGSAAVLSDATATSPGFVADVAGSYTATLIVNDGTVDSAADSVLITANAVNQPPTLAAIDDQFVAVDATLNLQADGNDPDAADALAYSLPIAPAGMTVDPVSGSIAWTPNASQLGDHSVQVRVQDGAGLFALEEFLVTVTAANIAPMAVDDDYTGLIGEPLVVPVDGVLDNDNDPNGDALNARLVTPPAAGDVTLNADGSFTYVSNVLGNQISTDINLTFEGLPTVRASSEFRAAFAPDLAIDGDLNSSWFTQRPPANEEFIEQEWAADVTAKEIQIFGHRGFADGFDFTQGFVQLFDVDGVELYNSGNLALPAPVRDLVIDLVGTVGAIEGVRRMRFTGTATERVGIEGGLAEFYLIGDGVSRLIEVEELWSVTDAVDSFGNNINLALSSTPVVIDLDGDGDPETIFATPSFHLVALNSDGSIHFTVGGPNDGPGNVGRFSAPAVGDIDGDGEPEIVAISGNVTFIRAWEADGTVKWTSEQMPPAWQVSGGGLGAVAIADLNQDGSPEIVVGGSPLLGIVTYSADGSILWATRGGSGNNGYLGAIPIVSDIDLDGSPDVIGGNTVYNADGTIKWQRSDLSDGWNAVGNFDGDPQAEVILVSNQSVYLLEHDGQTKILAPDFSTGRGGPPTVADFDNDGAPEVGVAGSNQYIVYDTDMSTLWTASTVDFSSSTTGSSVFDFENDGTAEVVYRDEQNLFIFDGATGAVRIETPLRSSTGIEAPVIADIDGNGTAEILITSDIDVPGGTSAGMYAFTSAGSQWANTRPLWNQHSYHVTNVNDDGSIPAIEPQNWLVNGLNDFRRNAFLDARNGQFDSFTYVANDGQLDSNVATVMIGLTAGNQSPSITSIAPIGAKVDEQYRYAVHATDVEGDTLVFSLSEAPAGMVIDPSSGLISWTPLGSQLGDHAATLVVTDEAGLTDTQSWLILVTLLIENTPPTANAGPDQNVLAGATVNLDASGSSDPQNDALVYAWTLDVPGGSSAFLSDPNGLNPSFATDVPGVYTANLFVSDGEFNSPIDSATITAAAVNQPPTLAPIGNQTVSVGASFGLQADGDDPDAGDALTYSLPTAPTGMSIDPVTGLIGWTPVLGQLGVNAVEVRVEDGAGLFATQGFSVTVFVGNAAPIAVDDENYEVVRQSSLAIAAPGILGNDSDSDGDALTATIVDDVSQGVLALEADGAFAYTPNALPETTPEMQRQCTHDIADGNQQTNSTIAVGDVDNDGDIELVGGWHVTNAGVPEVWILNADDCSVQLAASPAVLAEGGVTQSTHLGLLDIDGDGDLEIIGARHTPGTFGGPQSNLVAMHHDGTLAWTNGSSEDLSVASNIQGWYADGPTFADLDADGVVEIIMSFNVGVPFVNTRPGLVAFDSRDGSIIWEYTDGPLASTNIRSFPPAIADLDLDGTLEVIYHASVLDHNGNVEFLLPTEKLTIPAIAIANFDDDAFPELLVRDQRFHYLLEHNGSVKWQLPMQNTSRDQISVADFDGDGAVEFAYNTRFGQAENLDGYMVMFDTDGSILWSHENEPALQVSSIVRALGTNPTGFDYNRDGAVDLVVHYEHSPGGLTSGVYVFDGRNGSILEQLPTTRFASGYRQTFTTIADVDGDGEAEFVTSYNGGIAGETIVWGSAPGSALPPAPQGRNQWIFNLGMVNPDLSIPANPVPYWLQPGLNMYNAIPVVLAVDPIITDTFTYRANDGAVDSNIATTFIDILPFGQNAPEFVSTPDTQSTVGFAYEYFALAVDSNFGDTLVYSLVEGPAGTAVAAATGRVTWPGGAIGNYTVTLEVTDGLFTDQQSYVIEVGDPVVVPSVIGQTQNAAAANLVAASLNVGLVTRAYDATAAIGTVIQQNPDSGQSHEFGGAVALVLSLGPAPEDVDDDGDTFTENGGDCNDNDDTIFPGANDIPDDGIDQDCDGSDATTGPALASIVITPATATLIVGQSQQLTATGVLADNTSQNLTDTAVWSIGGSVFNATAPGTFNITATSGGVVGNAKIDVVAVVGGDSTPPVASITSPAANDSVTAPVDVIGTATDANFLMYRLSYAPAGSDQFTLITEQTAPVSGGVLGQLDPTMLINDQYTLRLTVFDSAGFESTFDTIVMVEADLKVGNFALSFTDLTVPVVGIPIAVTRNYDSRDKSLGDFGIGWQLGVQSLRVSSNRVLGTGWRVDGGFLSFSLVPTDEHLVTITLPDGSVETFEMVVNPNVSSFFPFPPGAVSASFRPKAGTLGTLQSLDNNFITILDPQPGVVSLFEDTTLDLYDPQTFRYTTEDGTEMVINRTDGLKSVSEPNGNTITFNNNGIIHSAGPSVSFVRDAQNRITRITDPNGNFQNYSYDENGDLVVHKDRLSNSTTFKYNRRHGLLEIIDPLGNRAMRNEYDAEGRLIAVIDAEGNRLEYAHDIAGREQVQTDRRGNVTRLIYDDRGNVLSRERTVTIDGTPTVALDLFEYDADDNEIVRVDADGLRTALEYDASGNVVEERIDPAGLNLITRSTYDAEGRLLSRTSPMGEQLTTTYDGNGNPLTTTDALGNATLLTYNAAGQLTSRTDPLATVETLTYDAAGRVLMRETRDVSNALLARQSFTYDGNGHLLTESKHRDNGLGQIVPLTTTNTYDANGNRLTVVGPDGSSKSFEYDQVGRKHADIDARGNRTEYVYDVRGNLIRTNLPNGTAMLVAYDPQSKVISETDPQGRVTQYVYDELGRRVQTILPDGSIVRSILSAAGRLLGEVDARGNRTNHSYDAAGRKLQTVFPEVFDAIASAPAQPVISDTYNADGSRTSSTDALGETTAYEYDQGGRRLRVVLPDGSDMRKTYDALGRVATETDQLGRITSREYDGLGRLIGVTLPAPDALSAAPVTSYTYDLLGNRLTQTDALGHTTSYTYDSKSRRTSKTLPLGQVESLGYDATGNLATKTDFEGLSSTYEYDSLNRLIATTFDGGEVVGAEYFASGDLKQSTDSAGTISYEYDAMGRATRTTKADGSVLSYTYDAEGNQTSLANNGSTTNYTYDALNRRANVQIGALTTTYTHNLNGHLVGTSHSNGVETTQTQDVLGRVTSITHRNSANVVLESFAYTYYADGQRESVTESDGSTETYSYDDLNRLVTDSRAGSNPRLHTYTYDLVGNRTASNLDGVIQVYNYDDNDRLLAGRGSYTYDARGNRLTKSDASGVTTYQWDARNRLIGATGPSLNMALTYDTAGDRVSIVNAGVTTGFVVDNNSVTGISQVLAETDGVGQAVASYIYGNSLLVSRGVTDRFYQEDAHGSVQVLTDDAGSETDTYGYDGFGNVIDSTGATENAYTYAGERFDAALSLYYLRARYYDAEEGIFLSRDPYEGDITQPQTLTPYTYVRANPVNLVDPSGQISLPEISIVQTIQAIVDVGLRVSPACKAVGTARTIGGIVAGVQLGLALITAPDNRKVFGSKVSKKYDLKNAFKKNGKPTIKELALEYSLTDSEFAFALSNESKPDVAYKFSKTSSVVQVGGKFLEEDLAEISACGASLLTLKIVGEGSVSPALNYGSNLTNGTLAITGEVKVVFEVETFVGASTEIPFLGVKFGGDKDPFVKPSFIGIPLR